MFERAYCTTGNAWMKSGEVNLKIARRVLGNLDVQLTFKRTGWYSLIQRRNDGIEKYESL